jgi:hypothetical protein
MSKNIKFVQIGMQVREKSKLPIQIIWNIMKMCYLILIFWYIYNTNTKSCNFYKKRTRYECRKVTLYIFGTVLRLTHRSAMIIDLRTDNSTTIFFLSVKPAVSSCCYNVFPCMHVTTPYVPRSEILILPWSRSQSTGTWS